MLSTDYHGHEKAGLRECRNHNNQLFSRERKREGARERGRWRERALSSSLVVVTNSRDRWRERERREIASTSKPQQSTFSLERVRERVRGRECCHCRSHHDKLERESRAGHQSYLFWESMWDKALSILNNNKTTTINYLLMGCHKYGLENMIMSIRGIKFV